MIENAKQSVLQIESNRVIEFVNLINEACVVIDDLDEDNIVEWLTTFHGLLGKTPLQELNECGLDKLLDLICLIEKDEADLID